MTKIEEYKKLLKSRLNEKRYYHSLCVADEALRLAKKYGANTQKAYIAGLLHDITKNATAQEHLHIFESFGIMLNSVEQNAEKLWHAISGAAYVEHYLGITDIEIIDAIRYHTTARADMTTLDKVLYLADFTSSDRDYDDVNIMRELVDISMEKALSYALSYSIKDLVENGRALHIDTILAYNENVLKGC